MAYRYGFGKDYGDHAGNGFGDGSIRGLRPDSMDGWNSGDGHSGWLADGSGIGDGHQCGNGEGGGYCNMHATRVCESHTEWWQC